MIPEETSPLNWKGNLKPDLLYQRHGRALINPAQQVQPRSDNIHHSHQLFQPADGRKRSLGVNQDDLPMLKTWQKSLCSIMHGR